jgi:cytochrome c biogenesis factor
MIKDNLLSKYYLATPLFMLAEFVAGASLRVSIPWGGDYLLYLYMAVCYVIGGLILTKKQQLNLFALIECSVNLFLLTLGFYLHIFIMARNQGDGFNFDITDLIHLIIVGTVLLYTFYGNPIIKKKNNQEKE